ncbi:MAG: hypothetical protein OIF50_01515 [Flavobacteriaceae bacterium]|nr:hypothetical protein [Flavobacteriaceae bacterium]
MNKKFLIFIIVISVWACKEQYIPEPCGKLELIEQTERLQVSDTLVSFWAATSKYDNELQLDTLTGEFTILFFKGREYPKAYYFYFNEENDYKGLGKLVISKNGNLIVSNEAKLMKIYGISTTYSVKPKDNVLIVADSNKVIRSIYKHACEEDILRMVEGINSTTRRDSGGNWDSGGKEVLDQ